MKKDFAVFLRHIDESIERIEDFTKGLKRGDFMREVEKQDAVIRRLEVIGEATKNLPKSFRAKHAGVRWDEMARMRDKLIHHYFGVDLKITWQVVKKDLPSLKRNIKKILQELSCQK